MIRDAGLREQQERTPDGALATATRELPEAASGEAGFTSIYETYSPLVYRTCLEVLRDPHEAQDATQETFIRAYREGDALPSRPGPWLRVVARNHSLDLIRRRARVERMTAQLTAVPTDADDPGRRAVNRIAVGELLKGLGPREQQVLVGSAVEDRTLDSLAGSLGLSYMGTAQLLHRAKRRARRLFGEAIALLLPFLPERFRSRSGAGWMQALHAAGRAPELVAVALVAAVLVAGPGMAPSETWISQPAAGPNTTAREVPGIGGQRLEAPSAPAGTSGQAPLGDAPALRSEAPLLPDVKLPETGQVAAPQLPQVPLQSVLPALPGAPDLPPVQVPLPSLQPPAVGVPPALPPPPPVPPITLTLPGPITAVAVSPSGADVAFQVSASGGEGALNVSCSRPSGSRFPIGATEVKCTASDAAGRTASGSFLVSVVSLPPRLGP
jgi:RNA polymerase sigma factor (sigma-70 family)